MTRRESLIVQQGFGQRASTESVEDARARFIRHTHPYGFRSGEWAEVLTTAPAPDGTDCYVVRFPDGVTDYWRVTDPDEPYEFANDAAPGTGASQKDNPDG